MSIPKQKIKEYERIKAKILKNLQRVLEVLDDREMSVIRSRFLGEIHHTLLQTGKIWGIKRERTRQIQDRALEKLRKEKII